MRGTLQQYFSHHVLVNQREGILGGGLFRDFFEGFGFLGHPVYELNPKRGVYLSLIKINKKKKSLRKRKSVHFEKKLISPPK